MKCFCNTLNRVLLGAAVSPLLVLLPLRYVDSINIGDHVFLALALFGSTVALLVEAMFALGNGFWAAVDARRAKTTVP